MLIGIRSAIKSSYSLALHLNYFLLVTMCCTPFLLLKKKKQKILCNIGAEEVNFAFVPNNDAVVRSAAAVWWLQHELHRALISFSLCIQMYHPERISSSSSIHTHPHGSMEPREARGNDGRRESCCYFANLCSSVITFSISIWLAVRWMVFSTSLLMPCLEQQQLADR